MGDRPALRSAATLSFAGLVITFVAGLFHPGREPANLHSAVFAEYAADANWTTTHLGQFVGLAIVIAGLLALISALAITPAWWTRVTTAGAISALALYGVLQAVDGVALKQAVDAWAAAPDAERAARFASAEIVRWMEWGVRSYFSACFGVTLLLLGGGLLRSTLPRVLGILMGVTGLAYLAQAWILGQEGFSPRNSLATIGAYLVWFGWVVTLGVIAWWSPMDRPSR